MKKRIVQSWTLVRRLGQTIPIRLLAETVSEWLDDSATRLSAALAFYTIFSLAPLLIFVIALAGFFFGESAARGEILAQLESLLGPQGAEYVAGLLQSASQPSSSVPATLIGFGALVFGSTTAFAQLQEALNLIWHVEPKKTGLRYFVRKRLLSFSLVLTIGFLLLVSLALSAILAAAGRYLSGVMPAYIILANVLNFILSFGITTLLFAAIYRILPDARVRWRDVWWGALVAALLFSVGRYLIGLYLGQSALGSVYGAAGSFVIILMWVYLSAQILFFGAEFTQVWARRFGPGILPGPYAKVGDDTGPHAKTKAQPIRRAGP